MLTIKSQRWTVKGATLIGAPFTRALKSIRVRSGHGPGRGRGRRAILLPSGAAGRRRALAQGAGQPRKRRRKRQPVVYYLARWSPDRRDSSNTYKPTAGADYCYKTTAQLGYRKSLPFRLSACTNRSQSDDVCLGHGQGRKLEYYPKHAPVQIKNEAYSKV